MRQQAIEIGTQTLNLYESEGTGRPVLLVHGNSSSALSYRHQLESEVGNRFHLIAIDLPGHGLSSPAADPASTYVLPGYATTVVALAERLGLENSIFVGWSLGGNILLEASDRLCRAAGVMIVGTAAIGIPPALSEAFLSNPALGFNFQAELSEDNVEQFARAQFRPGADQIPDSWRSDIRRADPQARQLIGTSLQTGDYRDEVAIVAQIATPLAVVYGEQEQLANRNYAARLTIPTLWRGAVQIIPDAGHVPFFERPSVFNPLLAAFIEEMAR